MKKGLYLLILMMMVFIPLNVFGASAEFSLNCPATVKKGGDISCKVVAKVTPAENTEEKLASVTGSIAVSTDDFAQGPTVAIAKTGLALTGENQTVDTFTLTTKATAAVGDKTISLTITEAKDNSDPAVAVTFATTAVTTKVKVLNNNAALKSLKIDGAESTCNLGEASCTPISFKKSSVVIAATADDSNATVTGTGTKTLKCGNNTYAITTTAEDKETKKVYNLYLNRTCNTDTTLKDITLSAGSLNPTFAATTKNYAVDVTKEIDKITISAEKSNSTQIVAGTVKDKALEYGDNKFTINVTSEDGSKASYNITVTREDGRDANNNLASIELSDGKLIFDKDTAEYTVKVLHSVEKVEVNAKAESDVAKVTITNNGLKLSDGINPSIIIKVTSEQGKEKLYKVIINRLKEGETLGDNPNLSSVIVEGYDLGFNVNKTDYTLKIENEDKLSIKTAVEENGTEVQIKGNSNLKDGDVITLTATSLDGTTKDYKIVIEKSNMLVFIIIASIVGVVAIAGIIILIIKNKKDKDIFGSTGLKNQLKEADLLNQVENSSTEKQTINNFGPTTPLSINGAGVTNSFKDNYKSQQMENTIVRQPVNEEPKVERPVVLEDTDATRVCSICGHRVSASLKTCPYCKRSF